MLATVVTVVVDKTKYAVPISLLCTTTTSVLLLVPDTVTVCPFAVGRVVSTKWLAEATIAEWVSVAILVGPSLIVPLFNSSVLAVIATPSVSVSPDATVYENTSDVVVLPDAYVAYLLVNPKIAIRGVPVTVTASLQTIVTLIVSPGM